jgi:preprotein translocase subunit SecF
VTRLNAVFTMIAILLLGLLSGTYSSIFNTMPLLVSWEKDELPFTRHLRAET